MIRPHEHTIEYSPLREKIALSRVLARLSAPNSERLVVFCTGIHGNEPGALFAAQNVIEKIRSSGMQLQGTLLVLVGNIPALEADQRFIDEDLNRIWKTGLTEAFARNQEPESVEQREARELYDIILAEASRHNERYFVDFHTTSSDTVPFVSVHDEDRCYKLAQQFPLHCVLGFSEVVPGSIDDFFRDQDFTGFTFEAGHNHILSSLENHEALMWSFLLKSCLINADDLQDDDQFRRALAKYTPEGRKLFRIRYRHALKEGHHFCMEPGFVNFQPVQKGQIVGMEKNVPVRAPMDGCIFMPLYQELGNEGFFIVQEEHKDPAA